MTHDSSPFRHLARDLAAREQKTAKEQTPAAARAHPAPRKGGRGEEGNADADQALFLDAVSRIRPLPGRRARKGGGERTEETSLGAALAEHGLQDRGKQPEAKALSGRQGQSARGTTGREAAADSVAGNASGRKPGAAGGADAKQNEQAGDARAVQGASALFGAAMNELFADARSSSPAVTPDAELDAEPVSEAEALFAKAMRGVKPVSAKGREVTTPAGGGRQPQTRDPAQALRDVLEGRVEFALHHTDEYMEGFVVGVDPLVLARLRAGQYSPEKHLDLHGMNGRQAYEALSWFIREAYQRGLRTVVVVTGRGRNSPDGIGVLRPLLQRWLSREPFKRVVLAFCTARPGDGGPGAVYVLLRKYKKSRGKIIWNHTPADEDFPDL